MLKVGQQKVQLGTYLVIVRGTFSEGFKMTQLPVAKAIGKVHRGTMIGKLNGTICRARKSAKEQHDRERSIAEF